MAGAVFSDVDGTLVAGSLPRIVLSIGFEMNAYRGMQKAQLQLLTSLSRLIGGSIGRSLDFIAVLRSTAGRTDEQMETLLRILTPRLLAAAKPASLARLKAHQADGLPLILLSGALHEGIVDLGKALGGRGEGTRMRKVGTVYTDKIEGELCQGEGKANRARQLIQTLGIDPQDSFAYGDTASDLPYLSIFGHPAAVDPDSRLRREAGRRGWPVLSGT